MTKNQMVTGEAGRVSGIRGRVVLAAAGLALALGTVATGVAHGALSDASDTHLRLGDVGWNHTAPRVLADGAGDVGWNNPKPGTTPAPQPANPGDVGWN
ncbi:MULTISPECIES: hypothetical protein [unclassified Streptomyces]|uniref:hypothetical protein n=1 Tax=unclassified Streptomyces TaxID=2593676 RepID=UPI00109ED183|nr:hypothetical protein [Streptomyces sp. A1136]THA54671.1 hypothetical protein E6R62_15980 [Streptomyces sp. A1136]